MRMFKFKEPRRYNHKFIYVDERKEKLEKLEEKAKRDLGLIPESEYNPERIRGKFIQGTKHLKRAKASGTKPVPTVMQLMVIIILIIILRYLITGELLF